MKSKELIAVIVCLLVVVIGFFYKVFLFGYVPIPGDLLVSEYSPWKAYSYLGYVPGSFPQKAQYFDTIRQLYPWKTLTTELLKTGELPLWNSYNFSGAPLLANFQSAVFYPLNIFYFLFSQVKTWTLLIILQPLLSGFFTYLFARKIGMSKIGSFLASITFAYCLFTTVFLEYNIIGHTIAWLPLSLYLVERLLEKIKLWIVIFLAISLILTFLAGHLQIASFVWLFLLIYTVFRIYAQTWSRRKKAIAFGSFSGLFILSLGICALQLFPTIELIHASARVAQSYQFLIEKLLLQPAQLILFLSPDFFGNPATYNYLISDTYPGNAVYVGIISFVLSLFALVKIKRNYFVRFFSITALILMILFVRSPLTEFFYRLQIPLFSTGSPTNGIFLLSFSLSMLAGFGIDQWLKKTEKFYKVTTMGILGVFIIVWIVVLLVHPQTVSTKNFLYSTIVWIAFLVFFFLGDFFAKKKQHIQYLFLFITILDLFYFFQKFNSFVPKDLVFPEAPVFTYLQKLTGIDRFWGYGGAKIEANFATQYKLFSPDGYDPLYPKRYGEFVQASKQGKIETEFTNQTRSDAVIAPGFGEKDLPSNNFRLQVLDSLGVKYILAKQEEEREKTFSQDRFKLLYEKDGWIIFENLKASPRVFLTSDYKIFNNDREFEQFFFSPSLNPSKTIFLEEKLAQPLVLSQEQGLVKTISYTANEAVFSTKSEGDTLLFLSDTYYPGWKTLVDGKETHIYRADYAFRAIFVPKGEHTVVFRYEPQSFSLGVKTTIISIILFAIFASIVRRKAFLDNYDK